MHPYLHEYGEEWYNTSPRRLCESAFRALPDWPDQQLVILAQVLVDDINTGYERLADLCVRNVNGTEVVNLKHLWRLVEECEGTVRFDLDDERLIVLDYRDAKDATARILDRYRIPSALSEDLQSSDDACPQAVAAY